jgi:hypothetical protein
MVFYHSKSLIEEQLAQQLKTRFVVDTQNIFSSTPRQQAEIFANHTTLLYSSLDLSLYNDISSYNTELNCIDEMIGAIQQKSNIRKVILLTYPASYINSENIFLRHKGIIEKKFYDTGLEICYLHVQAVVNPFQKMHNLHRLFYQPDSNDYLVPKDSKSLIYSVNLSNLMEIIIEAETHAHVGHFDVFDEIFDLQTFFKNYSSADLKRVEPLYLYFKSYMGKYASPSLLKLFLRREARMYSYRTEKEFGVKLNAIKPVVHEYYESQDYKVSPVFGTKGFKLST